MFFWIAAESHAWLEPRGKRTWKAMNKAGAAEDEFILAAQQLVGSQLAD